MSDKGPLTAQHPPAGLAAGAKGQWVDRWYLGITKGRFVHSDIAAAPEQQGETRAAVVRHAPVLNAQIPIDHASLQCAAFNSGH
jgi:hypothetical protein